MRLIQDLREFIELLNLASVQYLVIGGWAYNRYAEPRMTGDIDFFVSDTKENEENIRIVLNKFGFGSVLPPPDRNLFEKKVLMIGRPPNRIDIISQIDGVTFNEAWSDREQGFLDGLPLSFISKANLIRNKQATGRAKDHLDVTMLKRIK